MASEHIDREARTVIVLSVHGADFEGDAKILTQRLVDTFQRGIRCGRFGAREAELIKTLCQGQGKI